MPSPTEHELVASRIALAMLDPHAYRLPTHSVPPERALTQRALTDLELDLPCPQETAAAIEWMDAAAVNLRNLIVSVDGGDVGVELLEDSYTFLSRAAIRTYILRITGRVSGTVAQFVLPTSPALLYAIPVVRFISWVHAFERGDFGVPDDISPAQRELLVDFARLWEGFARQAHVDRGWYYFIALLRSLVSDPWRSRHEYEDSGFAQLAMLSRWAREYYPTWFPSEDEDYEDDEEDAEMPGLVEVYGSSDEE